MINFYTDKPQLKLPLFNLPTFITSVNPQLFGILNVLPPSFYRQKLLNIIKTFYSLRYYSNSIIEIVKLLNRCDLKLVN